MSQIFIAPSDTSLASAVNLTDPASVSAGNGIMVKRGGFHAPPPQMKQGQSPGGEPDDGSGYDVRTVTLDLFLHGTNAIQLHGLRRAIQAVLGLAKRSTGAVGGRWVGTPVCLWVQELESPNYVQFDVLRGELAEVNRDYGPSPSQDWTLTLTCLPFARGAPRDVIWTGTLTNGYTAGVPTAITLTGIPGDVPALCQVYVTDLSTGGLVLNGVRLGRRSLWGGVTFSPLLPVVATSPGVSYADVSAMDGAHTPRLTCSSVWQRLGIATCTDSSGLVALRPHLRDSSSGIAAPTAVAGTADYTGGALAGKVSYGFAITELDGSGNESLPSTPIYVYLTDTGRIPLTWTPSGTPTNHRVYFLTPAGWKYFATGSSTGAYTLSTITSAVVADPPSSSSAAIAGVEVRLSVALNVANPSFGKPCQPIPTLLRHGQWEIGDPRVFAVAPTLRQEGAADAGYQVLIEARSTGTSTPTLDCDGIWQYALDEPSVVAECEGLALAAAATFQIDTRRDGRVSGVLTDGAATPTTTGLLFPRGSFTLGQGTNIITVAGVGAGGVADVTNLKYKVGFLARPRYIDVVGLVT